MVRHRYGTDILHDYVRISGCSGVGDPMHRTTTTQGVVIGAGSASMHLVAIRREVAKRHPWVPTNLYKAFDSAKDMAMKRMINPRITPLAW